MLQLFTDTDTDITPAEAKQYGYQLISMPYTLDGRTIYPYEDFEKFDAHKFYDILRAGKIPTTSGISEEHYRRYFEPIFAAGNDILYVHFARTMTSTFDSMDRAIEKLKKKYPERKFYTIDTNGITVLSLNIVKEVGDMIRTGKTVQEVIKWAKREVNHFAVYFFCDDLKFFQRSGRVSNLSGTMGTILGIRPIIHIDDTGQMVSIDKVKGRPKALDYLVAKIKDLGKDLKSHRIIVASADAPELAQSLVDKICAEFGPDLKIEITTVNPTIGSHCGPDTVGVSFYARHR